MASSQQNLAITLMNFISLRIVVHFAGTIGFHVQLNEYDSIPIDSTVIFNLTIFNQGNG